MTRDEREWLIVVYWQGDLGEVGLFVCRVDPGPLLSITIATMSFVELCGMHSSRVSSCALVLCDN